MTTLKAGALAYIDGFGGLIPCRVIRIYHDRYYDQPMAEVKITGGRPGYPKGDTEHLMVGGLVTRNVKHRKYHTHVRSFDGFELDAQETLT